MNKEQIEAAISVVGDALGIRRGDHLLVISDEHTEPTAKCFEYVAKVIFGAQAKCLLVKFDEQRKLSTAKSTRLPVELRRSIEDFSRVIFLQLRKPEVNHFRQNVMEFCRENRARRTASMPGVTMDYLPLCKSNLPFIEKKCKLVSDLIVRSSEATIETQTLAGEKVNLTVPLGDYNPITSTGRIEPGDWGNVPSGETFIVPNPRESSGTIAINGSFVNYIFSDEQELVLQIEKGKVQPLQDVCPQFQENLAKLLYNNQGREVYENCAVVSELGIGANPDIKLFTGLPLFDEKVFGSIHIGLGRSTQFKGPTSCKVHNDFVSKHPTLKLDSIDVVSDGSLVLKERDVYPSWKDLCHDVIPDHTVVRFGTRIARIQQDGCGAPIAELQWVSPRPESIRHTQIGDCETSELAAKIIEKLVESHGEITVTAITKKLKSRSNNNMVYSTLRLMEQFRVLRFEME